MKNGILILFCLSLFSCATPEQELQLRYAEMAHALEVMKLQASLPKPVLYESIAPDGTRTVVYSPVSAQTRASTYQPRPLPRADLSTLLPILTVASVITGQYYGFRTSEAMFSVLKNSQQTSGSNTSSSMDGNTINYNNTVTTDSSSSTVSSDRTYGDYSGNLGAGYDAHTDNSGRTDVKITDSLNTENINNSQRTIDLNYTETSPVVPVVQVVPVVVTPTGGSSE